MKTHKERLDALTSRGFTCEHPGQRHQPVARDGTPHASAYLEGRIHGVPQCIFLSIGTGLVMLIKGDDYTFDEFLAYCDEVAVVKPGQRGLFGSEE